MDNNKWRRIRGEEWAPLIGWSRWASLRTFGCRLEVATPKGKTTRKLRGRDAEEQEGQFNECVRQVKRGWEFAKSILVAAENTEEGGAKVTS